MFVVDTCVQNSDDTIFHVVASVSARRINTGRHRLSGFYNVERNHHVLHFNNDHAWKMVNVHQGADRDFIHDTESMEFMT